MSDIYVSVIGSSSCDDEQRAQAEEVGRLLAVAGCIVVCGGMDSGVMAAVARGAMRGGGRSIGLLPDLDRRHASPDLTFSLCTERRPSSRVNARGGRRARPLPGQT
jgi:uncharacterized protein (TIGR00725 family)